MKTDQNIIYEEKQKLNVIGWILKPMILAWSVVLILFSIPILYFYFTQGPSSIREFTDTPLPLIMLIGGLIPCLLIVLTRRRMKLELAVTRKGLQYEYLFASKRTGFIKWEEVVSIEAKKFDGIATRPGSQRYYWGKSAKDAIIMNTNYEGIEITFTDGQTMFLTCNDRIEFLKAVKKLELPIKIL